MRKKNDKPKPLIKGRHCTKHLLYDPSFYKIITTYHSIKKVKEKEKDCYNFKFVKRLGRLAFLWKWKSAYSPSSIRGEKKGELETSRGWKSSLWGHQIIYFLRAFIKFLYQAFMKRARGWPWKNLQTKAICFYRSGGAGLCFNQLNNKTRDGKLVASLKIVANS